MSDSILDQMKAAPIWLLWRSIYEPGKPKPRKVPYYVSGIPRNGALDSPEDRAQLVAYDDAADALEQSCGVYAGLAIALGPDGRGGHWQGIDLDAIEDKGLSDIANRWVRGDCAGWGYIEVSPSVAGAHIIGYGQPFPSLGSNSSGIEAYAGGRFFTFTGQPALNNSPCRPIDLAPYVDQHLAPRHGAGRTASSAYSASGVFVDPKTVTELRSALLYMRSDDRDLWIRMGMALKELSEVGRGLWLDWSATSEKFDPKVAARTWDSFKPSGTSYQAVFAEAQRQGWVNPVSNAAQATPSVATDFQSRTPRNFLNAAAAPPLDLANVPAPVAEFARACSSAYGFDQSGLVMAAITAAAAMVDDSYQLEAMPRWFVSARLWTVLIGKSATGKSPALKMATAPIKEKHNELAGEYNLLCSQLEKGDEQPPRPALYTSDATIESLSDRLKDNPRGMMMLTEEFSSWIGGIDSSDKGDAVKSRGNWLQLYDGGPYQIDRIMRGSILVENWGTTILTASTPSGLAAQMKHLPEDGLIQRFIPVLIGSMDHSANGDAGEALDQWREWLFRIYSITGRSKTARFSPDARKLFLETKANVGRLAETTDDISSGLASHVSKHTEMIARLALIFHFFDPGPPAMLSIDTLRKAINLMAQLRRHSVALFTDILGASPATDIARGLARSLAAAEPGETQFIGRDWMTQHCRAFEKAKDDRVRREAVQLLEDLDWLRDAGKGTYTGWPKRFEVNRNVFRLYAREGEAHRARRAAMKAVFEEGTGQDKAGVA